MSTRLAPSEVRARMRTVFQDPAGAGDNTVVAAPGVGFKTVVYGYQINANGGANNVRFRSTPGLGSIGPLIGLANQALTGFTPGDYPLFETAENEILRVNLSAATAVGVQVQVTTERV